MLFTSKKLIIIFSILAIAGGFVLLVNKYKTSSTIGNEPRLVFEEIRQWQIASDALVIDSGDVTSSGSDSATTSPAIIYPAYESGDLIIMFMMADDNDGITPATTGPNGETRTVIGSGDFGDGDGPSIAAMWFVGNASISSGTQTWSIGVKEGWVGRVVKVLAGEFDSSNPIDSTSGIGGYNGDSSNVPTPSWSTSTANGRVLVGCAVDFDSFTGVASGWTDLSSTDIGSVSGALTIRDAATTASETIVSVNHTTVSDSSSTLGCVVNDVPPAVIDISGTSNSSGGTVRVAVNNSLKEQTTTLAASWTITGVSASAGNVITVYVESVADSIETTGVTKYGGTGNIGSMVLDTNVLTIGSDQDVTLTRANLDLYDCSQSEDVMHQATGSSILVEGTGCNGSVDNVYSNNEKIAISASDILTVGVETLTTQDITINGTLTSSGNSVYNVSGDWANNGTFTADTSTVTFDGAVAQAISGSTATSFSGLTVTNASAAVSSSVNFNVSGIMNMNGTDTLLTPAAAVVINSAGATGTITGSGTVQVTRTAATPDYSSQYKFTTNTLTNLTVELTAASDQIISAVSYGNLKISTASVTATLVADTTVAGDLTISSGGTLDTGTNYALDVGGDWTNAGTFTSNSNVVTFNGSALQTITSGGSSFNDIVFNNSFANDPNINYTGALIVSGNVTLSDAARIASTDNTNFSVTTGTINPTDAIDRILTLASGSADITVGGAIGGTNDLASLAITGNDITIANIGGVSSGVTGATSITGDATGAIVLTGTIYNTAGTQAYDAGGATNPITLNDVTTFTTTDDIITFTGTVDSQTAETNAITLNAGAGNVTFSNNIGGIQSIGLLTKQGSGNLAISNNSSLATTGLTLSAGTINSGGGSGVWTVSGDVTISSGTLTSTSGTLTVSGNWANSDTFAAGTGTVAFSATAGTSTINPGASAFNSVVFNDAGGSATFRPTANMTVNADFTLTDGVLDLNTNNPTMIFGDDFETGNFTIEGGSITPSSTADFILDDNPTIFYAVAGVTLGEVVIGQSPADTILTSDMAANTITVSAGDGLYTCRYDLDAGNGGIQVSGVLDTSASGDLKCSGNDTAATYINTANDFNLSSTATFVQDESTVEFDDPSGTDTLITDGAFSLYNLVIDGGADIIIQVQDDLDVDNNVTITSGALDTVSGENNQITVGGSWSNADEFTARSGLVLFDSADTGETINSGGTGLLKDFYDIQFNNNAGGWTIQTNNLTATHNFTITDTAASGFTVNSVTTEVQGTYSIADAETSNTTWTLATLYLNSGTAYMVGSKIQNAETYATLHIGANTNIRMWESSAATAYTVDAFGSLYSQDHASVAGDLYIWGNYHVDTNDYWSYANDFNGAAGANRQVDVRIDPAARVTVDSGDILTAVGVSGNRTTVSRQGASNGYEIFCLSGGTINFQHTDFDYLDGALGIDIQGGSTVTSLDNTAFDNLVGTAGTADAFITVASTVIGSGNKTITGVKFDNTGTGAEFNVNRTGVDDTGHWDFNNSTPGAFDGEANDGDDGVDEADPGMLQWDDSISGITVDGFIYSDEGSTPYLCSTNLDLTIVVQVNGSGDYTAECTENTGAFSVANVTINNASDVLTIFVNEEGSFYATTVTKAADTTSGITVDLYQNHVIIRHEDGGPMTIDNLNSFDFVNDNDVQFTADNSTPDLLTVNDGHELYILAGDTFTPGGNVTVDDIKIPGIYTATGTEAITVSGSWVNSGTFTAASSTVTFDNTSDTEAINSTGASTATFNNLVLGTGSGTATWNLGSALDVDGNLTIDHGTLGQGTNNITLGGNLSIGASGNFTSGSGIFTFDGTTTPVTWNNTATIDDLGAVVIDGTTKTVNLISSVQATSVTVGADDILGLASSGYTLTISGSGTAGSRPFIVNNASGLTEGTSSTVKFTGTSAAEIEDETYYHLELAPTSGSPIYTLGTAVSQTITASGNLTIGNGSNVVTVSAVTNDPNISVVGNVVVSDSATFTNSDLVGATLNIDGNLTINSTGTFTAPADTAATSFTLAGDFSNSGTFNNNSGTVTFDAGDAGNTITDGGHAFHNITFNNGAGSWLYQDGATAPLNQTTVQAGTPTFFNTKTGTQDVSVTGGTLNVDWYLGVHAVNAADTLTNIDTNGSSDITISEANSASTVWRYSSGWGSSAASQTTGTGVAWDGPSAGINAQVTNTGAIRIREYSMTNDATCPGAGCTLYKYNLDVVWQPNYGQYNYHDDYGEDYLTSCMAGDLAGGPWTCSNDSTDDDTIGVGWYRSSAGSINGTKEYDGVNESPTQGSWYVGLLVGLSVSFDTTTIGFDNLNAGVNNFTDTAQNQITVTTSATNGYVVTAWETQKMTHNDFPAIDILNWTGDYATPAAWAGNCVSNGQCGFGFTSDDDLVGGVNRYNDGGSFYAGFSEDPADPIRVADSPGPISGNTDIITYKISVLDNQQSGTYSTTIVYVITAEY